MKDAKHHLKYVQKKVVKSARRENNNEIPEPSAQEMIAANRKPKYYNPNQKRINLQRRTLKMIAS